MPASAITPASRGRGATIRVARAALVLAALFYPREAQLSGAVMVPVPLAETVGKADLIVVGTSLGFRDTEVRLEGLAVPEHTRALDPVLVFKVRELGVRVDQVLAPRSGGPAKGAELWLVDPASHGHGLMGRLADVAWVAVRSYAGRVESRVDAGKRVLVLGESAAHRRGRGESTAGLDDRAWLAEAGSWDAPAIRPQVLELLRKR